MTTEFTYLPALISPTSPTYFFVDKMGVATNFADIAADQQAKQDVLDYFKNLNHDAVIRQLDARESNLNQFPYETSPAIYRQIVNKTFEINGVKVTIRGDEPSIRSVISVLSTYPPKGPTYITDDGKETYVNIGSNFCPDDIDPIQVPNVGMERITPTDPHIVAIIPNGKKYSGSGTILLITDQTTTSSSLNDIYIPFFRDVKTNTWSCLGGRIDMPNGSAEKDLTLNILYNNAIRESREESADLIQLKSDNQTNDNDRQMIDIKSDTDSHMYRAYIHYLHVPINPNQFTNYFAQNVGRIIRDANFGPEYRETNDVTLIQLNTLINRTEEITTTTDISNIEYAYYTKNDGIPIRIRGRTIRVLDKLFQMNGTVRPVLEKALVQANRKNAVYSVNANMNHLTA